jgi:tetratricopeptide (TPR) repeat protein
MMSQPSISELAKQGNPNAIASLITHSLKPRGITARVRLKGECLRIMLESKQVPDQQVMVRFIHQGMTKLKAESIKTVKVYGKQVGSDFPAWSQEFDLEEGQTPSITRKPSPEQPAQADLIPEAKPSEFSNSLFVTSNGSAASGDFVKDSSEASNANVKAAGVPKRLGQFLVGSLGLRIGFDSLFVIYSLVWATSYYIYNLLDVADATGFLAYLIHSLVVAINSLWNPLEFITVSISRITIVIMLVWLYRLHAHLRATDRGYPISPWGAVARFTIPFYNFWGIWNLFATFANWLKSQGSELGRRGTSLINWLPWLYLSLITSNLLNQINWHQVNYTSSENFSPWLFLAKAGASLFLSIILLQIVRIISKAVLIIASNSPRILSANSYVSSSVRDLRSEVKSQQLRSSLPKATKPSLTQWRWRTLIILAITAIAVVGISYLAPQILGTFNASGSKLTQQYKTELANADKAIRANSNDYQAWYNRGKALFNLERYNMAIVAYDKAIQINANFPEAWSGRSISLRRLDRLDEALASADKAIQINPNFAEGWKDRCGALSSLQRTQEALTACNKAVQIKPDFPQAWYNRGLVLTNLRQYEEAFASFDRAVQLKPDYYNAWNRRSSVLSDLQRYEEVIVSYDKVIQLKPDDYRAWINRGNALDSLQRYEEAIASYDQAIQIGNIPAAWYNRALTLETLGRYQEALASYNKATQIYPNYAEAWYNRGVLLEQLGRYEEALDSYNRAIESGSFPAVEKRREDLLHRLGR